MIFESEATALAMDVLRYRLDVKRPGSPVFVPESFHETHADAFDAGLLVVTGQCADALPPRLGWDFKIERARWALS